MTRPAAGLADVLPGAFTALGVAGLGDGLGVSAAVGDVRRIAVLLVDGLGYHLLPTATPVAPTIADVLAGRLGSLTELACAFPSTTPTSLVTIGTGAAPGAHGILGFTDNVPGTDRVLTHIDWGDEPDPRTWQPVPSLFTRAAEAGVAVTVLARPEYEGSGLTEAAYGGARYVAAAGVDELADRMLAELRGAAGLVYGYHPSVDTAAHVHGIASPRWLAAVTEVDRLLGRLVAGLPGDAALLVTADHGGLNVPADRRYDIDTDPRLGAGVAVVAGEPRARYLHTLPGAASDVIATWRAVLGDSAIVISRDEAVAAGWFGPVPPDHLARIGDVVVACQDDSAALATTREPAAVATLIGFHGSTTPAEVAIPLMIFRGA